MCKKRPIRSPFGRSDRCLQGGSLLVNKTFFCIQQVPTMLLKGDFAQNPFPAFRYAANALLYFRMEFFRSAWIVCCAIPCGTLCNLCFEVSWFSLDFRWFLLDERIFHCHSPCSSACPQESASWADLLCFGSNKLPKGKSKLRKRKYCAGQPDGGSRFCCEDETSGGNETTAFLPCVQTFACLMLHCNTYCKCWHAAHPPCRMAPLACIDNA